ncbi:MAG: TerC family protein [Propionibacteriaceae bacterium]|jgi:tellurite resistance protein TerC|nr:TerC family protein [Propionibacteriaceae bacterium]
MHVTPLVWTVTLVILVAVLLFDVLIIGRRPHEPSMKECSIFISIYIAGALLFTAFVAWFWRDHNGHVHAVEFFTGWLTEYSLSLDNLFIFLIIMQKMKVPRRYQQFALMVGIILALVFRGIFIALGAAIIARFAWVFFIFGAFLIYTAIGLVGDYRKHASGEAEEEGDNFAIRLAKKKFHFTDDFRGTKLAVKENGRRHMTPMFLVIVALGSTDILFALDSIPAIYGLTQQPYLVFAATVFALMGLRQLYFLIGGLVKKLVFLSLGLSVILAFIGVKLVIHALHHYHVIGFEIPMLLSLAVIVVTLIITAVASILYSRSHPEAVPTEEPAEAVSEGAGKLEALGSENSAAVETPGQPSEQPSVGTADLERN